jgi:hypothetical protein
MKFDRKCRQRLLSPSSGINVFVVLPVVLQILTAQGAAAPSIGSSAILTIQKPRNQVQASGFGDRNGVLKLRHARKSSFQSNRNDKSDWFSVLHSVCLCPSIV